MGIAPRSALFKPVRRCRRQQSIFSSLPIDKLTVEQSPLDWKGHVKVKAAPSSVCLMWDQFERQLRRGSP